MAVTSPIKISADTDRIVSHIAHFTARPKKAVVEEAVREYVDNHRDEINESVRAALAQLDGTRESQLSVLTGLSSEELADLGGLPD